MSGRAGMTTIRVCEHCGAEEPELTLSGMTLEAISDGMLLCGWCADERAEYEADAI